MPRRGDCEHFQLFDALQKLPGVVGRDAGAEVEGTELEAHFRYPQELFRVQTTAFARYHLTDPDQFYEQTNGWSVAQDPGRRVFQPGDQSNNAPGFKETQGEAFIEILRHLPRDAYGNHGGVAATLMVTISEESLRERSTAAGITEHGTAVSVGQLRQLACNARILPAVLGSKSQILDVGREQRLHTPAQRKALAHRDGGCAFPSCERPPGWCETHHIKSWADGGETTLDNGVLLCGYHHRHIHNSNWRIETNSRDRLPDFYPPGSNIPKRNMRYRPLVA